MLDIYIDKYNVDFERLKQTTNECFVQFRMADSLDKGLQAITRVTKYITTTQVP
jgi:hypothetical protein